MLIEVVLLGGVNITGRDECYGCADRDIEINRFIALAQGQTKKWIIRWR